MALIAHLRQLRYELLPTQEDFQERLREAGYDRTLVRIADALMWGSHPDTWIQHQQQQR